MAKRFNSLLLTFFAAVWAKAELMPDIQWDDISFGTSAELVVASTQDPTIYIQTTQKMDNSPGNKIASLDQNKSQWIFERQEQGSKRILTVDLQGNPVFQDTENKVRWRI